MKHVDEGTELRSLPITEEFVRIDKTWVDRGGYRITKSVSSDEHVVDEPLRQQQVHIERRPVGVPVDGPLPEARYEGDTFVVPVVEEVLVTQKRLVLVEEIRITRTEASRREPQRVTLRKEQVSIERLEADEPSVAQRSSPLAEPGSSSTSVEDMQEIP